MKNKNICHSEGDSPKKLTKHTKRFFAPLHSALNDGRSAFTLAEVLITLTIIGVIAALTIPNLMQKWQEHHTVAAVKEAYSLLDNAFKMTIKENGELTDWDWPDSSQDDKIAFLATQLKPFLKITQEYSREEFGKISKINTGPSCYNTAYKSLTGKTGALINCMIYRALILANGMTLMFNGSIPEKQAMSQAKYNTTNKCTDCTFGYITVDINGYKKGPNRHGYDIFTFSYYFDGINLDRDRAWSSTSSSVVCTQTGAWKDWERNGYSCSYWVLMKSNTDYQKHDVGTLSGGGWQGWK